MQHYTWLFRVCGVSSCIVVVRGYDGSAATGYLISKRGLESKYVFTFAFEVLKVLKNLKILKP